MGTPIKKQILDNLVTTVAGITTAAGYNQTVKSVFFGRPTHDNPEASYPLVFIWADEDTADDTAMVGFTLCVLNVGVLAWLDDGDDPALATETLLADLKKAIQADVTRGGYAIDTVASGPVEVEYDANRQPITGVGYQEFNVRYAHKFGDPFTQ